MSEGQFSRCHLLEKLIMSTVVVEEEPKELTIDQFLASFEKKCARVLTTRTRTSRMKVGNQ